MTIKPIRNDDDLQRAFKRLEKIFQAEEGTSQADERDLPDEADNHLIELAVAAQADVIVTGNLRDLSRGELKFPALRILSPEDCLEMFPCRP